MSSNNCQFPRCVQPAQFCFADETGIARFCEAHKDDTMIPLKRCAFPRCTELPLYAFADEAGNACFCTTHKSSDMVLANGATAPKEVPVVVAIAASSNSGPSPAALELAFKYFEVKPE